MLVFAVQNSRRMLLDLVYDVAASLISRYLPSPIVSAVSLLPDVDSPKDDVVSTCRQLAAKQNGILANCTEVRRQQVADINEPAAVANTSHETGRKLLDLAIRRVCSLQ